MLQQIRRLLRSRFWQTPIAEKHNLEVREVDSDGLIWQANTDRWSIRRADRQEEEDEDPELVAFHEFLQNESEAGNVSRQVGGNAFCSREAISLNTYALFRSWSAWPLCLAWT